MYCTHAVNMCIVVNDFIGIRFDLYIDFVSLLGHIFYLENPKSTHPFLICQIKVFDQFLCNMMIFFMQHDDI